MLAQFLRIESVFDAKFQSAIGASFVCNFQASFNIKSSTNVLFFMLSIKLGEWRRRSGSPLSSASSTSSTIP